MTTSRSASTEPDQGLLLAEASLPRSLPTGKRSRPWRQILTITTARSLWHSTTGGQPASTRLRWSACLLGVSATDTTAPQSARIGAQPRPTEASHAGGHASCSRLDSRSSDEMTGAGVIFRRFAAGPRRRSAAAGSAAAPSPAPAPPRHPGTVPPRTPGPAAPRRAHGSQPRPARPS